jgi:hypothetical protein
MKLLIVQFPPAYVFGLNILLSTQFSNTINPVPSLNVSDQVLYSLKKDIPVTGRGGL